MFVQSRAASALARARLEGPVTQTSRRSPRFPWTRPRSPWFLRRPPQPPTSRPCRAAFWWCCTLLDKRLASFRFVTSAATALGPHPVFRLRWAFSFVHVVRVTWHLQHVLVLRVLGRPGLRLVTRRRVGAISR